MFKKIASIQVLHQIKKIQQTSIKKCKKREKIEVKIKMKNDFEIIFIIFHALLQTKWYLLSLFSNQVKN